VAIVYSCTPADVLQLDTTVLPAADCAEAGQTVKEICTDNPTTPTGLRLAIPAAPLWL
jgi:hypothetical protein